MFPLKNTEAYIHANGFRSTLGKELADRDTAINELGSEIQALTNYVTDTGVKNFLNVTASTTTDHGVTFTVSADNIITVSGDADGLAALDVSKNVPLKPDNYILSGNSATNIVWNSLVLYNGSTLVETIDLSSATGSDIPLNLASKTFDNVTLSVKRKTNGAVSGTISPMIRLASITDPTYQPYAMTNKELTEARNWKLVSTMSGTAAGTYPTSGNYTDLLFVAELTSNTDYKASCIIPFTNNFKGRLHTYLNNEAISMYFNGSGACQGSSADYTYHVYVR